MEAQGLTCHEKNGSMLRQQHVTTLRDCGRLIVLLVQVRLPSRLPGLFLEPLDLLPELLLLRGLGQSEVVHLRTQILCGGFGNFIDAFQLSDLLYRAFGALFGFFQLMLEVLGKEWAWYEGI